jgi:hypothetical protein
MSSATKKSNNVIGIQIIKENRCEEYLASLSEKELKGYEIAKSHLGSTFSVIKSNGYIKWEKNSIS